MPRKSRIDAPGSLHHIIVRGIERPEIFKDNTDRNNFLDRLGRIIQETHTRCFAWSLITNHPPDSRTREEVQGLALFMKRISGRQMRYVNKLEGRRGTLWEGRYKSNLIHNDQYLLACCRYGELNPLRAGIVESSEHYQWSSYRYKVGIEKLTWLDRDPSSKGLGRTQRECEAN